MTNQRKILLTKLGAMHVFNSHGIPAILGELMFTDTIIKVGASLDTELFNKSKRTIINNTKK